MPLPVLAVDLAEKCSAAVIIDDSGKCVHQTFCQDRHLKIFGRWFHDQLNIISAHDEFLIIVEDVFLGASRSPSYKPVVQKQGIVLFMEVMHPTPLNIEWVMPQTWQKGMGYKSARQGGTQSTKAWAKDAAALLGLEVIPEARGSKALEDIRDAFLIGRYWQQRKS